MVCAVVLQGLHGGEEQHIANGGAVGQQHHQAIQAKAQSARGRHTILQGVDKVLVHLGMDTLGLTLGHLSLKAGALVDGVIQLREGVAHLVAGDEKLKALRQPGIFGLALGQGRNLHRVIHNEGRLLQLILHKGIEKLGEAVPTLGRLFHMHAAGFAVRPGFLVALPGEPVHAAGFLHRVRHGHALPGRLEMNYLSLVSHVGGAQGLHGHKLIQALHHVHNVLVVGVCLVGLHGGKLRVVGGVHTFVAEDASHFVYPFKAAHNQPLQVQFRLNAQEHVDIQSIVVGTEGAGGSADFQGMEHRRVHLQEAFPIQELPHGSDDLAALAEGIPHLGIHDHVYIPLTVAQISIHQAVELFGQHLQGLAQERNLLGMHGNFPRLGFEHDALYAQDISQVVLLKGRVGLLAHVVALDIDLDFTLAIQQVGKGSLAHDPAAGHPAGNGDRLSLQLIILRGDFLRAVGHVKAGNGIGVLPGGHQCLELLPANLFLFG